MGKKWKRKFESNLFIDLPSKLLSNNQYNHITRYNINFSIHISHRAKSYITSSFLCLVSPFLTGGLEKKYSPWRHTPFLRRLCGGFFSMNPCCRREKNIGHTRRWEGRWFHRTYDRSPVLLFIVIRHKTSQLLLYNYGNPIVGNLTERMRRKGQRRLRSAWLFSYGNSTLLTAARKCLVWWS